MLSTKYASDQSGLAVRVRTLVGVDLGEIDSKLLAPLKKKAPDTHFVVNAVLASDSSFMANHAVTIVEADGEKITVCDPKYETLQAMTAEDFWNRWISANMQTIVTIAKPTS